MALPGDLVLEVQPIRNLRTGRVDQHEALVRLRLPGGQMAPPAAFIPQAERDGTIEAIDRWVVREAIALAGRHRRDRGDVCVSLNLSARSVGDDCMLGLIVEETERRGVDPAALIFEITETAAIAAADSVRRFAVGVASLGCRMALDDFGTGFGSLLHLKQLPVDFIKIDGQFVRHLSSSSADLVLVSSMVEIAEGLGMETVAEQVEEEAVLRVLEEQGVDRAQGFLIGRPAPASEVFHPGPVADRQPR